MLAKHHAGRAIETGQAANNALVISKMPVAMHLDKMGEYLAQVIKRVGAFCMAGNFGDLPGRELAVDVFGELQAFLGQLIDLARDVYR